MYDPTIAVARRGNSLECKYAYLNNLFVPLLFVLFKDAYALFKFSDHYHMSIAMAHTGLLGGEIPSGQRWFHGQGNAPPGTMPQ